MPLAWSFEHARAERIGAAGVAAADLADMVARMLEGPGKRHCLFL
jgi:hypothetical protein